MRFFLFLGLYLSQIGLKAQPAFVAGQLDALLDLLATEDRFMGSIALWHKDRILYSRAIGYADRGQKIPADTLSRYRIGSISKTFTAALVFKAIESKKLSLNTPLSKFYPKLPNAKKIQIRHLLQHSSGLHSFTDDADYLQWNTRAQSQETLLSKIQAGGSLFEPGSDYAYSNSNYLLLGYILEKIYKKQYSQILTEQICTPLGLNRTYCGGAIDPIERKECRSYSYLQKWGEESETDMSIPGGAGALVSTPSDLLHFAQALFSGALVSKESLAEMMRIEKGFGKGLFKIPFYEHTSYGHTGAIDGFASMLGYFPEQELGLAICSNGVWYDYNNIAIAALSDWFGKAFDTPKFAHYQVTAEDFASYTGEYVSALIPLKIKVWEKDGALHVQATDQPAFVLEAQEQHIFRFDRIGLVLEFVPAEKKMVLKQNGQTLLFYKD